MHKFRRVTICGSNIGKKDGSRLGLDTRLLETRVADLATDLWDDMYSDADKTAKEFNQTMGGGR